MYMRQKPTLSRFFEAKPLPAVLTVRADPRYYRPTHLPGVRVSLAQAGSLGEIAPALPLRTGSNTVGQAKRGAIVI